MRKIGDTGEISDIRDIAVIGHLGVDNGTFGREIAIIGQLFADNGTFGRHRRFSRGAVIGTLFKVPPPVPGAG